jgi:lactoylglutathione lyase
MKLRIGFVSLFVRDHDKMVRFYRDVIGLPVKADDGAHYAEFENEGVRFAMFQRELLPALTGKDVRFPPDGLNGSFELAVPVGARDNVDTVFAEIVAKGGSVVYPPRDEPWHMRSAMVADPEGNLIEIASDFWA